MKVRWISGAAIMIMLLMGGLLFTALNAGQAAAYGPGRGVQQAQTTPLGTGYGPGMGMGGQGMQSGQGMMLDGQGYGRGARGGGGGMGGPGNGTCCATGTPISTTPLSEETKQALTDALNDEYKAQAAYQAIIDKFGAQAPFSMIIRAEGMHINALQRLFTNHGLAIPADTYAGKVQAPATLKEAYQAGVDAEKANIAMYDRLLQTVKDADVVTVFQHLQAASRTHLATFEAYNK
jgi:hypothetical protein